MQTQAPSLVSIWSRLKGILFSQNMQLLASMLKSVYVSAIAFNQPFKLKFWHKHQFLIEWCLYIIILFDHVTAGTWMSVNRAAIECRLPVPCSHWMTVTRAAIEWHNQMKFSWLARLKFCWRLGGTKIIDGLNSIAGSIWVWSLDSKCSRDPVLVFPSSAA